MEMNDAQRKLAEDNIPLVYYLIAREYPTYKYDEDLAQVGILGLCKAAMKWDESKGLFSTFAGQCIRNEIRLEFRSRRKEVDTIPLDTQIECDSDNLTLGDMLEGGEDTDVTQFTVEAFLKTLTADERVVYNLKARGYKRKEIAEVTGFTLNQVRWMLQIIRQKYLKFK